MTDDEIQSDIILTKEELETVETSYRHQKGKLVERIKKAQKTLAKRASSHFRPNTGFPCWVKAQVRYSPTSYYWARKIVTRSEEQVDAYKTTYYVHGFKLQTNIYTGLLYEDADGKYGRAPNDTVGVRLVEVEGEQCSAIEETSELNVLLDLGISIKGLRELKPFVLWLITPEGPKEAVGKLVDPGTLARRY